MNDVRKMLRKVRAVVMRQGAHPQDADDIVQEAFARLESYMRAHELRSQEAFLITTAVNVGRDQARRDAHRRPGFEPLDLSAIVDSAPQPEERLHAHERLRRASSGLMQLDPLTRRCLLAHRVEGQTFPQIALTEKMSVAAVEKRVARAVMFLTQWMGDL
jgi:RNA polymerase sigma factor (sigma-70 family)